MRMTLLLSVLLVGCVPQRAAVLDTTAQECLECAIRNSPDANSLRVAPKRFRKACKQGDASACSVLGVMHEQGRGVAVDLHAANRLYQRACRGGNAAACSNLGRFVEHGAVGKPDPEAAEILYDQACRAGSGAGCWYLGLHRAERGQLGSALLALTLGCNRGSSESCHDLGAMYQHGRGVPKHRGIAKSLYTQACRSGSDRGCTAIDLLEGRHTALRGEAGVR